MSVSLTNIAHSVRRLTFFAMGPRTHKSTAPHHSLRQSGNVFFAMFAAIAMVGAVGFSATEVMKGPIATMQTVTKRTIAEDNILASAKLTVLNAAEQVGGGDCDGDGLIEPMAWSTSGTGTAPAGGGFLPPGLGVGLSDPWGRSYGYCVWDHGSAIRNGSCASDDRLAGQASGAGILVSIISSGPDKIFQTSCAASPAYVQKIAGSDDIISSYTYAEAQKEAGGLWNVKSGDDTVAQIGKKLEVKDGGGNVTFALDNATGAGTFEGVTTGTITGFGTDPVEMGSGLQLATEADVGDGTCAAGEEGTLRYHSTSGVQVCDGADFVAVGAGGGGAGYSYSGLYEGKISVGFYHTCGIRTDGAAYCWGINTYGQLGDATTVNKTTSTLISGGHKFVQISTGRDYSCGLRTDGAAMCWGRNDFGQLGSGNYLDSSSPIAVTGGHKFVSISSGLFHACGLRTDGAAMCWGANSAGSVGDGTTTGRNVPTLVTGSHKFIQVSAGNEGACGIRTDGAAMCWGWNTYGTVGDGTTTNRSAPTAVSGGHKFVKISSGSAYNCGLRTDGTAYCWGINDTGQFGNGTTTNSNLPVAVSGDHVFKTIASGVEHVCGIRIDGVAMCWARNDEGHTGDGTTVNKLVPTVVLGGADMANISASGYHTCGIKTSGATFCWGYNNVGQLGDGTTVGKLIPTPVSGFSMLDLQNNPFQFGDNSPTCNASAAGTVRYKAGLIELCDGAEFKALGSVSTQYNYSGIFEGKLSAGGSYTCIIRANGISYCLGANVNGQFGTGGNSSSVTNPTPPVNAFKFVQISAGTIHSCGLRADGAAYCSGSNGSGRIGDGTTTNRFSYVAVTGSHKFVRLSAGEEHTCGIRTDGAVYCWGNNTSGRLGDGTTTARSSPTAVTGSHKFVQVSAGYQHSCGLRADGVALCWGANGSGQLGDGTTTSSSTPIAISGYKFSYIAVGRDYSCGIRTDGAAYCWGANGSSQLGDGTTTNRSSPTAVSGGYKFTQIATGSNSSGHTCAIATDGTAYCWGLNTNGRLGDNTTTTRTTPVPVSGGGKFVQISVAVAHSCGIRADGTTYCWGYNINHELGDGTQTARSIPTHTLALSMTETQNTSFKFGNDATSCGADNAGALRYGGAAVWEYCNGTAWTTFATSVGGAVAAAMWETLSLNDYASTLLRSNGDIYSWTIWGDEKRPTAPIGGGHKFIQVAEGGLLTCGLRADGAAYCQGDNTYGQQGNGTNADNGSGPPTLVSGGYSFKQIVAGSGTACALRNNGAAYCWGNNQYGRLGNNSTTDSNIPVAVDGSHVFQRLVRGHEHFCGIRSDGDAYCWGRNHEGQLGDNSTTDRWVPTAVSGGHKFIQMDGGRTHTCGVRTDSTAYCWGLNDSNQLGDTTTTNRLVPTAVTGGHKFTMITVGGSSTCGIRTDGAAYCWGLDWNGRLGTGGVGGTVPTVVSGGHKFLAISFGSGHACGIRTDGTAYCWGSNYWGGIGDGTTTDSNVPVKILEPTS